MVGLREPDSGDREGFPNPENEGCKPAGLSVLTGKNLLSRPTGKTFLPGIPHVLEEALSAWKDGKPGYCSALQDWIRAPLIYSVQFILYDVVFDELSQK